MPRTARQECESSTYHVVNRGSGKRIIFESDEDRAFFMQRASASFAEANGSLYAYCLMDNHFHLVVRASLDALSSAMHKLQTSYAGYFNRVYGRNGALFGARFRSEPIDTDEYLMCAVRYVHANPVKAGICKTPDAYSWSSYNEYLTSPVFVDTSFVLGIFDNVASFVDFHSQSSDDTFIEPQERSTHVSDPAADQIATKLLGQGGAANLKSISRDQRNEAIAKLKRAGLGVRQIQRLTGVSLAVISGVAID